MASLFPQLQICSAIPCDLCAADLPMIPLSAVFADQHPRKGTVPRRILCDAVPQAILLHLFLHPQKYLRRHNGRVCPFRIVFRQLAVIVLFKFREMVCHITLLKQSISGILFILEHIQNTLGRPHASATAWNLRFTHDARNLRDAHAIKVRLKDPANDG